MKSLIREIATKYNVNYKALKFFVKEDGVKPKKVTRLQLLEILYINCIDLFYTRMDRDSNIVEFLDKDIMQTLTSEMNKLRKVNNG
ncbi:MAG: hypothetical protein PHD79_03660 [Aliarcobacter sp.]|nr:hypothetical protein [Aliarcobacter sp.]